MTMYITSKHIVKRKGHKEMYEDRKLYASVYATCMSLRVSEVQAETIAKAVVHEVEQEIKEKEEVTAHEISHLAKESLKKYNEDAAYLYEHHRDVS